MARSDITLMRETLTVHINMLPRRTEYLGGQRTTYVQLDNVLAVLEDFGLRVAPLIVQADLEHPPARNTGGESNPNLWTELEDKFFVAGQMDAQGTEAEKWKTGNGGPVLAMSKRLLRDARGLVAKLKAQQQNGQPGQQGPGASGTPVGAPQGGPAGGMGAPGEFTPPPDEGPV